MIKFMLSLILINISSTVIAGEHKAPDNVTGTIKISHQDAKKLHDEGVFFLDTRGEHAYNESRIPSAIHLDVKSDNFKKENFKKIFGDINKKIVIYCNGEKCLRSSMASQKAVEWGYKKIYYFRSGFPAWVKNDYPIE